MLVKNGRHSLGAAAERVNFSMEKLVGFRTTSRFSFNVVFERVVNLSVISGSDCWPVHQAEGFGSGSG